MKNRVSKINKDMENAIRQSGYLLEQEIDNIVRKGGYLTNPIYTFEKANGEIKEIDILGESPVLISEKKEVEFITTKVLIEVKNISPVICFTRKAIAPLRCFMGDFQFSGMPEYIWTKKNEAEELPDFLNIEKYHHYYKNNRISSQLCIISEKRTGRQGETCYLASHRFGGDRNLYDELILPSVEGIIHLKKEKEEDWAFDANSEPIDLEFYYPIAVVTDLYEYCIDAKKPSYNKVHRVNFVRMHKAKEISGDLLRIDICDANGLKQALKDIDDEMKRIINKVKTKKALFRESALKDAKERWRKHQAEKNKKKRAR
jgi:hypothetical protein